MIILLYALNRCLIRNGLALLQDDQWHQWILAKWQQSLARPCGRGCGAQQAGEARCEAHLCGSRRTAVRVYPKKTTTGTQWYLCMSVQW